MELYLHSCSWTSLRFFFTFAGKAKTKTSVRWLGVCRSPGWVTTCKTLIQRTSNDGTTALFTAHRYVYTHTHTSHTHTHTHTPHTHTHITHTHISYTHTHISHTHHTHTHSNQYRLFTRKVTLVKNSHLQFWYSSAQKIQRYKILPKPVLAYTCRQTGEPKAALFHVTVKPYSLPNFLLRILHNV